MSENENTIFVSYSRLDIGVVTPIVQIMRAIGQNVFHDIDSIPYGEKWRPVITDTIEKARMVIVFWCAHACRSEEVRAEYEQAADKDKFIVPALLDDTPLPTVLNEYQFIDFRSTVPKHDASAAYAFPGSTGPTHTDSVEYDDALAAVQRISAKLHELVTPDR